MKYTPVVFVVAIPVTLLGLAMFVPGILDLVVHLESSYVFLAPAVVVTAAGMLTAVAASQPRLVLRPREVLLVTTATWALLGIFGSIPFMLALPEITISEAVFESVSGITTTGSTVLANLDNARPDILLWRSMLQWLGGIGIIAMAVAVLPFLQVGGMRLFRTESSDWSEKALPRVRTVAGQLAQVYVAISVLCAIAYWLAGMTPFDAINHAMTTVATGGYSTHDASIAYFSSPLIEWLAVFFMLSGAVPFMLYVRAIQRDWRLGQQAIQPITLVKVLGISSVALTSWLAVHFDVPASEGIRLAAFNVTSIVTTTGYASVDYMGWGAAAVIGFFFLTFIGGCSGSTAGGIKIFRFQIAMAAAWQQIRSLFHPRGIFPVRYGRRALSEDIIRSVMAFAYLFAITVTAVAVLLGLTGLDFITSLSGAATAVANVGPGLGPVIGPAGNFESLHPIALWGLCAGMILGRLEILTVLAVFTVPYWRG